MELQRHLWGSDLDANDTYMSWKYEYNPYLEDVCIYLVWFGESVVGMRGVFGVHWQLGMEAEKLPMVCMGDLVVHPKHRDKGLFKRLMDFAMEDLSKHGIQYIVSLSPGNLTQISAFAVGWRCLATLNEYQHPGVLWRVRRKIRYLLKVKEAEPFNLLDRRIGQTMWVKGQSIHLECDPRPEQMADLAGQCENDDRIRHDRSHAFFSWRYKNPLARYRFLYAGDLDGYLVLQTSLTYDTRLVRIVDWEARDPQAMQALLRATVKLCRFVRLSIILKPSETVLSDSLQRLAFVKKAVGTGVADYRPLYLIRAVSQGVVPEPWMCGDLEVLKEPNWKIRPIISDGV